MLDIPVAEPEPAESCEVVYSAEMEPETSRQLGKLKDRVKVLEDGGGVNATARPAPAPEIKDKWLKRNAYWFFPVLTLVLGSGFFSAYLGYIVDTRITSKLIDPLNALAAHKESIAVLEAKQNANSDLLRIVLQKEMSRTLALPPAQFKQELPQLNEILNVATQGKTPASASLFGGLGGKLLPLAQHNDPEAWQATVSLASYHSVFNQNPFLQFTVKPITQPIHGTAYYDEGVPPTGDAMPVMKAVEAAATKDTGALYAPIGVELNPNLNASNQALILEGGGVVLDGHQIRNVVFIGVHVVYNGGPVVLESAVFISCRFTVQQNPSGEQFIALSLGSERTTFTKRAS